ncbi:MAG: hypothetical protein J5I92_10805 [Thiogranum sp.]|nr:hypothetical protein [Thiogranum sp.]
MSSEEEQFTHTLSRLVYVFAERGDYYDAGCLQECFESAWALANSMSAEKPVRAVEEWEWWDLIGVPDGALDDQLLPAIIVGLIVRDSSQRFPIGGGIRTSPVLKLYKNFIVETRNTFYVLVGSGSRKSVEVELLGLLL